MVKFSSVVMCLTTALHIQSMALLTFAFNPRPMIQRPINVGRSRLQSSSTPSQENVEPAPPLLDKEKIEIDRFVVQNRFRVRAGREAAFEKRWADRESRLGNLSGFRFFCMLRRVDNNQSKSEGGKSGEDNSSQDDTNYISCTVWENFDNFDAWRKGDAFKEAHGGGTVGGVAAMLIATAKNTKGKPKPAYWQGLLPVSTPGNPPSDGEGWRRIEADGKSTLPRDCFVAMNRFAIQPGMHDVFEDRFAARESSLTEYDGFQGFLLLRRDGAKKAGDGGEPDDGVTHSTFSIWKNRDAFEAWKSDSATKEKGSSAKKEGEKGGGKSRPPNLFTRPPIPSFYEGILALESAKGV